MESKITTTNQNSKDLITFTQDQLELIRSTIAKDATDDEFKLFLYQCKRTGLDPLLKQIYFQKYKSKNGKSNMTIITAIDGYRLIADRRSDYAGSKEPAYEGEVRITDAGKDDFLKKAPDKATVTVLKFVNGIKCEFSASVFWDEYYPRGPKGHMWRKLPHGMLSKCAEAHALRKAFPHDLSGIYTTEEMDQSQPQNRVIKNVTPSPKKELIESEQTVTVEESTRLTFNTEAESAAITYVVGNPQKIDSIIAQAKTKYDISDDKIEMLRKFANQQIDRELDENFISENAGGTRTLEDF